VPSPARSGRAGLLEFAVVVAGLSALTAAMTYPLAFKLSSHGYRLHVVGDHQYSVWNVAWVAHALLTNPLQVFHANIFYPHRWTLLYSEANLAAGAIGLPVYWLTRDAFATHNFVVLASFVLSGTGTYYLVRYLTGDRHAAAVSAVAFAYCPYVFGHLPHIQLLMTAGIPFSLLAFHRMADQPTVGRGAALGAAMGLQGLACAYYSIFVAIFVGFAVIFTAAAVKLWREPRYWRAVSAAAVVAIAIVLPLFVPYFLLDRNSGFGRTLEESRTYSASWLDYVTAGAHSAAWFVPKGWKDTSFPGFIAVIFGATGAIWSWKSGGRPRYLAGLYVGIAGLALWFSLGPAGGLYWLGYRLVPGFSFLRAPSRFGMVVTFALCVLAGLAIAALLKQRPRPAVVAAALLAIATAERVAPIPITPNPQIQPVYSFLATQPYGAVAEFPPLSRKFAFTRTRYMLASTVHWMPLVNAYSDFTPESFDDSLDVLAGFPSRASIDVLQKDGVRYAIVHVDEYRKNHQLDQLEASLAEFGPSLTLLYKDNRSRLYALPGASP
jgi:hypothetical protein